MTTNPYTLSDLGIHGPGLGSAPISLEQFRAEPDTLLLALNQAYAAGWLDGCKAAQPTIDAYRAVAEGGTSMLRKMLANATKAEDAKALDPMLADMEALGDGEPVPIVKLGPGGDFTREFHP